MQTLLTPLCTPVRTTITARPSIPAYYISVASQDLKARQARWKQEQEKARMRPEASIWQAPSLEHPQAGRILHIGTDGSVLADTVHEFVHGLLPQADGLLTAHHHYIRKHSRDLRAGTTHFTHAALNDIHTLRRTQSGLLITASGTDAIIEIADDGSTLLWEWWAHEHGFEFDHFGQVRQLDKSDDHRAMLYPTWLHAAHVNSAIELADGSVAATFFMQGIVGRIDRASGDVHTLVSGLRHPHALRRTNDGNITYTDTARGIAHLVAADFTPLQHVRIETNWLQDCQLHNDLWILVDAQHARVYFAGKDGAIIAYDQFDENWDFFEVAIAPE